MQIVRQGAKVYDSANLVYDLGKFTKNKVNFT